MTAPVQKTILIGVGNPFRSDDRVGRVVVQRLRKDVPPDIPLFEETGDGAELFDAFRGADCVILVDAVQSGAPPGTIQRFDARAEKLPACYSHSTTQTFGVAEPNELARTMEELPDKLIVYGIEGLDFSAGTELSPEVAESVPVAANLILQEILHLPVAPSSST